MPANTMLPTLYQNFIHQSRYARYLDEYGRRETWPETVERYQQFWLDRTASCFHDRIVSACGAVQRLEIMPSMRALMTAGEALERDHVAGYNCSYRAVDDVNAFHEIFYILLCGAGVGFSVERQFVNKLPVVVPLHVDCVRILDVQDSKNGWVAAYGDLIDSLYHGCPVDWDLSQIRPAGARLRTFGGRASGPEPLNRLFKFTVGLFRQAQGRKLDSIEVHDLICMIADVVVVGGVRRAALISLSDLDDEEMRHAKSGEWYNTHPWRALANNSAVYTDKVSNEQFMQEWYALYRSGSGERGIFNRDAVDRHVRNTDMRVSGYDWGTNPCSEIILRSAQFCNLTEVVVRPEDDLDALYEKIGQATFLGTLQSTLTDFSNLLGPAWRNNCNEERLLGVSLTGICDNDQLSVNTGGLPDILETLRAYSCDVNSIYAYELGIGRSASVTCVKPSGTVSQLVNSSSGLHARHSQFYIRRVRADAKDPLAQFMISEGFPYQPDIMKPDEVLVFSFPQASPLRSRLRSEMSAVAQLELWNLYAKHWCTHKPSCTVSVRPDEWLRVGDWVQRNLGSLTGVSFLPYAEHTYAQAPYEEVPQNVYEEACARMPNNVDFRDLRETEVYTNPLQELACTSGSCDLY